MWTRKAALMLTSGISLILAFFAFQKQFVNSFMFSGIK